ncbi:MFS transporter [Pseudonocardia acaciae]|uniref:MFS transporter n=1 Tax=Pseudonocardia acaciae TaxID=551276 RepID=UPI00055FE512|nr:MFS transporter [Pseudonocardia acaciae]
MADTDVREGSARLGTIRKIAVASTIGNGLEYYDFFLYGTAAALVFGNVFFSAVSPLVGTLASFATFAVGFGARPLGAIVFSHFGDRVGRKPVLVVTLTIMGVSTFLIGLLPSYDSIGIWAPVLLVILRLGQGLGLGGEAAGAQLLTLEHAPPGKRGFYTSWPAMATQIGSLSSTGMILVLNSVLGKEQFLSWGWRLAFLLSIVVVAIGVFIRSRVSESPVMEGGRPGNAQRPAVPLVELVRTHRRELVLASGMWWGASVGYYINNVFSISYLTTQRHLDQSTMLTILMVTSILSLGIPIAAGALSDRCGRRPVLLGATFLSLVISIPYFSLLETAPPALILVLLVLFNASLLAIAGIQPSMFGELFGPRVRYSGVSVAFTAGTLVGGAVAPFIATALLSATGGATWAVTVYLVVMMMVSAAFACAIRETRNADLVS